MLLHKYIHCRLIHCRMFCSSLQRTFRIFSYFCPVCCNQFCSLQQRTIYYHTTRSIHLLQRTYRSFICFSPVCYNLFCSDGREPLDAYIYCREPIEASSASVLSSTFCCSFLQREVYIHYREPIERFPTSALSATICSILY